MKKLLLLPLVAIGLALVPVNQAGAQVSIGIYPGYYGYYPYGYYRYYGGYPYYRTYYYGGPTYYRVHRHHHHKYYYYHY